MGHLWWMLWGQESLNLFDAIIFDTNSSFSKVHLSFHFHHSNGSSLTFATHRGPHFSQYLTGSFLLYTLRWSPGTCLLYAQATSIFPPLVPRQISPLFSSCNENPRFVHTDTYQLTPQNCSVSVLAPEWVQILYFLISNAVLCLFLLHAKNNFSLKISTMDSLFCPYFILYAPNISAELTFI